MPTSMRSGLLGVLLVGCGPRPAGTFETLELRAQAVDQVFTLTVFEPDRMGDDSHVVYLFDGDDWSEDTARIVTELEADGLAPPLVVGIGYGDRKNRRARDLTPAGPGLPDGWGGAEDFTLFLTDELVPFVDERWATDSSGPARTVLGHSFGGAAAMYALFAGSETFGNAISLSPSLMLGHGVIFELEADVAAANDDLDARVFLGAGALESHGLAGLTEAMGETLAERDYPGLEVQTELYPGRVHSDVFSVAAEQGLRFVLEGS